MLSGRKPQLSTGSVNNVGDDGAVTVNVVAEIEVTAWALGSGSCVGGAAASSGGGGSAVPGGAGQRQSQGFCSCCHSRALSNDRHSPRTQRRRAGRGGKEKISRQVGGTQCGRMGGQLKR